jgi:hypothetical protein
VRWFPQDSRKLKVFVSPTYLQSKALSIDTSDIDNDGLVGVLHDDRSRSYADTNDDVSQLFGNNTGILVDRAILVYPYFVPS